MKKGKKIKSVDQGLVSDSAILLAIQSILEEKPFFGEFSSRLKEVLDINTKENFDAFCLWLYGFELSAITSTGYLIFQEAVVGNGIIHLQHVVEIKRTVDYKDETNEVLYCLVLQYATRSGSLFEPYVVGFSSEEACVNALNRIIKVLQDNGFKNVKIC